MTIARVECIQPGQQGLKLRLDAGQLISAVTGVETTCFAPTDDPVMVEAQLQAFNRCGGARLMAKGTALVSGNRRKAQPMPTAHRSSN